MSSRRTIMLVGVAAVISGAVLTYAFLLPKPPPAAPPDLMAPDEYQRLLAIKLTFEPHEGEFHTFEEGIGEHGGGKPPVTPHPHGPAFGDGVKVAMTDAEFFQFYQAYQSPKHPVFVTSDSLVQAYFGILHAALVRAEAVEAWDLRDAAVEGLKKLNTVEAIGPNDLVQSARRLARINLAIVARLFNPRSPALADAAEEAIVKDEAARAEAAGETRLPGWLHRAEDDFFALDYRMFQSVGERRSEWSKQRFRALRWLQIVPWRIDRDDHLLATLLAARATDLMQQGTGLRDQVGTLLMPPDDIDASQLAEWHGPGPLNASRFATVREAAAKRLAAVPPRLNDQIRLPPGKPVPYARWRSAGRSVDLVALKQAFGVHKFNGLALCASLGSSFARSRPEAGDWAKAPPLTEGDTLGSAWWAAAATLFQPPSQGAPGFMGHLEWQLKSCQTALSGWVLWRHATEAHGKSETAYLSEGGLLKLRGAVEPNPEFFRKMERLANRTANGLRQRGLLETTQRRCAALIPDQLAGLAALRATTRLDRRASEEATRQHEVSRHLAAIPQWFSLRIEAANRADAKDVSAAALVQFWDAANRRQWPDDPNAAKLMKLLDEPTEKQLKKVAALAARCAELAEKQLAGKPFSDEDDSWFLDYGRKLAGLAGYFGDADDQPVDDAAKAAEAAFDPGTETFLTIAVGRPRALWVLYPYQGRKVLCRGAVYPYYEFDSAEKPSDESWQQTVREGKQPPPPSWLTPLLRRGGK